MHVYSEYLIGFGCTVLLVLQGPQQDFALDQILLYLFGMLTDQYPLELKVAYNCCMIRDEVFNLWFCKQNFIRASGHKSNREYLRICMFACWGNDMLMQ